MESNTVPFEIPNVNHGFVEVKGLFRTTNENIVLEFDERDGFVGMVKSDLKEVEIPYSEIESIILIKNLFRTKIELVGKSMKIFQEVPGSTQGTLHLKVRRKDRMRAEKAISNARLKLSEFKLKELDDEDHL